jgi:hypothetical protein
MIAIDPRMCLQLETLALLGGDAAVADVAVKPVAQWCLSVIEDVLIQNAQGGGGSGTAKSRPADSGYWDGLGAGGSLTR